LFLLFILSLGELGGNPSRLDGIEIGRAVSISGRRVTLCPLPGFVFYSRIRKRTLINRYSNSNWLFTMKCRRWPYVYSAAYSEWHMNKRASHSTRTQISSSRVFWVFFYFFIPVYSRSS
jgi:hypothetical protein